MALYLVPSFYPMIIPYEQFNSSKKIYELLGLDTVHAYRCRRYDKYGYQLEVHQLKYKTHQKTVNTFASHLLKELIRGPVLIVDHELFNVDRYLHLKYINDGLDYIDSLIHHRDVIYRSRFKIKKKEYDHYVNNYNRCIAIGRRNINNYRK